MLASLLWLALAAVAVMTLAELGLLALDRPGWLLERQAALDAIADASWSDPPIVLAATIVTVLGLLLLVAELRPRTPRVLSAGDDVGVVRRGLERDLQRVVIEDADVVRARVRVARRSTRVRAEVVRGTDRTAARERLEGAVRQRTEELGVTGRRRIHVELRAGERRVR